MFEELFHPWIFGSLIVLIGFAIFKTSSKSKLPKLPLLNSRKGEWFPYYRTRFRNMTALKEALRLAKAKHKDETMLLTVGGHPDIALIPSHETQWFMKQPDDILSRHAQTREELAIDYGTYFDEKTFHESKPNQIINGKLNGQTANFVPAVLEELIKNISRVLGSDTNNFHDVCVYEAQQAAECQVSAQVFSGLPICRDPNLTKSAMVSVPSAKTLHFLLFEARVTWCNPPPTQKSLHNYCCSILQKLLKIVHCFHTNNNLFRGSSCRVFLGFLPKPLKVLAPPLATLPNRKYEKASIRLVRPGIEKRLRAHEQRLASDPEKTALDPEPNDFLQWTIYHAMKSGDPHFYKVEPLLFYTSY